jgi:hypothetical protein
VVWGSLYIGAGMHVHETVYSPQVHAFRDCLLCPQGNKCLLAEQGPLWAHPWRTRHFDISYPVQSYIESPISLFRVLRDNGYTSVLFE